MLLQIKEAMMQIKSDHNGSELPGTVITDALSKTFSHNFD